MNALARKPVEICVFFLNLSGFQAVFKKRVWVWRDGSGRKELVQAREPEIRSQLPHKKRGVHVPMIPELRRPEREDAEATGDLSVMGPRATVQFFVNKWGGKQQRNTVDVTSGLCSHACVHTYSYTKHTDNK